MRLPLSVARGVRLPSDAISRRDWALMQAVEMLDRTKCPGCGEPSWLSFDPATENKWKASLPKRCHSCTQHEIAHEKIEKDGYKHPRALHIDVEYMG